MSASSSFKPHNFYSWPPFYTLQPTEQTRRQQLELWNQHIIDYCKFHNKSIINIQEDSKSPLFSNQQIQRALNFDGIKAACDNLVKEGFAIWHSNTNNNNSNNTSSNQVLYVSWHNFVDWSGILYRYAESNSLIGSIVTLYELQHGDSSKKQEFYGLNENILLQAVKVLETQGRAVIVPGDNIQETGIKFKAQ